MLNVRGRCPSRYFLALASIPFAFAGLLLTAVRAAEPAGSSATENSPIDFNRDVRPILSDHCFACHGPDANQRKAGLRLDKAEAAHSPSDSGDTAVVPGDLEASMLIARIDTEDPYEIMPPPDAHKPLSAEQKAILHQWIQTGGQYAEHWSLVPPRRHERPDVENGEQYADAVDVFLLAKIHAAGLTANAPADRRSLLRRLTFDLTGLPPTVEELAAFVNDPSPDAYEKVVDRLLDSPRFGEHMGRYWLDLVRYGDTHGLHLDNYREMWPYRDWVIRAFNENKPFDVFFTEQLAGDLLPGDELDHQIASGFNRLNVTTSEGGSIYEEVFARNVIDRTDAFGTIFLGLTMGCSVCHDHKFDPIEQRDYYSLSAFFNSLDGQALDGNAKDHPPVVRVPTREHLEQLEEVRRMRADLEQEMNGPLPTVEAAQSRWEQAVAGDAQMDPQWMVLQPTSATTSAGEAPQTLEDGSVKAMGSAPDKEVVTIDAVLPAGGPFQLLRLDVLTDTPEELAGRSSNGNAVLSEIEVLLKSSATGNQYAPVKLVYGEADHEQSDGPKFSINYAIDGKVAPSEGWAIAGHQKPGPRSAWFVAGSLLEGDGTEPASLRVVLKYESQYAGHSFKRVKLSVSSDLPRVSPEKQLEFSPWHIVGPFETENDDTGYILSYASQGGEFKAEETFKFGDQTFQWRTADEFKPAAVNALPTITDRPSVVMLHRRITAPTAQPVTLLLGTEDGYQLWMDGKKLAEVDQNRTIAPLAEELTINLKQGVNDIYLKAVNHNGPAAFAAAFRSPSAPIPTAIRTIAAKPIEQRDASEAESIQQYYRRVISIHPDWLVLKDMAAGLRKRVDEINNSMPTTLVWKEVAQPRQAHILKRGEYDKPGEAVPRAVPRALPPMKEEWPRDRLGLAMWLASPEHPLTARVAVNRFWQHLFGVGIVKTSEDFGAQGRPAIHPELLDTLAVDFREGGWNVKELIKRLVMTAAYQRSAAATPEMLAADPENRLLARGPRFRLEAEMIRDSALASSGLLVEKQGGPSVKPPQPDGLWRAVGYTSSNTAVFKADEGEKIYRRSVYTFWKRTSAPPQMTTFDAPSRESCTARRERTNTPLQALLLMNEPQYLEAARKLAARAQSTAGGDTNKQLAWMYETVTSQVPSEGVQTNLQTLFADLQTLYTEDEELRKQFGTDTAAEAALTLVASTILNLDLAITK